MSEARRFVGTVLLLASTAALAADGDRTAVIAVGKCDEASGIAARSFRSALAAKPDAKVASEAETAQPFGGTTDRTLAAVTSAISSARSDFYAGQGAQAKTTLQGALDDVARLAPSDARWGAERDALTLLAQVQQKSDPKAAEAALNRVFRVEPDYQPDTSNYPPSFQKYVNGVRKAAKKKSTSRLEVTTSPAGKPVYVGGRKVGVGPVSVRVPPGEYRVEADWGYRGAVRTVTVPGAPVELSAAVEGAVHPDGGPCVEGADASAALARAVRLTGTSRIIGVHPESAADDSFVVATTGQRAGAGRARGAGEGAARRAQHRGARASRRLGGNGEVGPSGGGDQGTRGQAVARRPCRRGRRRGRGSGGCGGGRGVAVGSGACARGQPGVRPECHALRGVAAGGIRASARERLSGRGWVQPEPE
jgi:hypothetical protein